MSPPELRHSTVSGVNCAWAVTGDGPPLVLLHGWGASLELTWPLAERVAAGGFRVYLPDFPGFGASALPPAPWSVRDHANFVLEFLDQQELRRVDLGGHSFGGRVALMLGAEHGERIRKLLLFNAAGLRPQPSLPARLRLKSYRSLRAALRRLQLRGLHDNLVAWHNGRYGSADYLAAQGVMRETFLKVVNEDLAPYARRVRAPALLFWGDRDEETPLWMGRELEAIIPDAGLIVWQGAGHYSYLDRLADTTRVTLHFLRDEG